MSTRRQFLWAVAGSGVAAGLALSDLATDGSGARLERVRHTSRALGANLTIEALHRSYATAAHAVRAAFDEIALVDSLMSLYRLDSELSRLNGEGILEASHPYLVEVLERAQRVSVETGGAFDATVQPLWDLYASAHAEGRLPDAKSIDAGRSRVDYRRLEVDPERIRLRGKGMAVTLNGIAQGFALDRALDALRRNGIENALVDSGELGGLGAKDGGAPWMIGIQHPRDGNALLSKVEFDGRCIATSGDYATAFTPDRSYNHIFDPATGRSPTTFSSVTVAAQSGVDADALSTALFVLGVEKGLRLVENWTGADALLVLKDGKVLATPGFPRRT
jgi:thiamine biosynthesis lipoprotein